MGDHEIAIVNCVAAVYTLENEHWHSLDGGASRVCVFHDVTASKFRIVALCKTKGIVMNTWVQEKVVIEQLSDLYLGWRESEATTCVLCNFCGRRAAAAAAAAAAAVVKHYRYGVSFVTSADCSRFLHAVRLAISSLAKHNAAATMQMNRKRSNSKLPPPQEEVLDKSYDPEIDDDLRPISFSKSLTRIEEGTRDLLVAVQCAVSHPRDRQDHQIAKGIGEFVTVSSSLLKMFISKVKQNRVQPGQAGNIEKTMRGTFKSLQRTGTEGVCDEWKLKAAVGARRYTVQRILVGNIHSNFAASLSGIHQLIASLNAIKGINNKSNAPGRHESTCMLQFCAMLSVLTKTMKTLADDVATMWKIAKQTTEDEASATTAADEIEEVGAKPFWEEIKADSEERVSETKAYTLNELVWKLTSAKSIDQKFLISFITTYQSFCLPHTLFRKLVERYDCPDTIEATQKATIQFRVVVSLKYWVEHHFSDFDEALINDLLKFTDRVERGGSSLRSYVENQVTERNMRTKLLFTVPIHIVPRASEIDGDRSLINPVLLFFQVKPEVLAQQLTLIDHALYKNISATELLNQAWNNKKIKYRAPTLMKLASRSTALSWFVATMILVQNREDQRIMMINKFVRCAEELHEINNFHTLMAVLAGLNTSPIHRMKKHWMQASKKRIQALAEMNTLMHPEQSHKAYREQLKNAALPALPYVGVHLTDITFIEDGNPDEKEGKLNYNKREKVYESIEFLQRYQSGSYEFETVDPEFQFLKLLPHLNEETLYTLSLRREPREK